MTSVYISENDEDWQSGASNSLESFSGYGVNLSSIPNEVDLMIPKCRQYIVPACRDVKRPNRDVFQVVKMPLDRLNYRVDFSEFAASMEDSMLQCYFVSDAGDINIDRYDLIDNVIDFTLSAGSASTLLRLVAETESGLRKVVKISIRCG